MGGSDQVIERPVKGTGQRKVRERQWRVSGYTFDSVSPSAFAAPRLLGDRSLPPLSPKSNPCHPAASLFQPARPPFSSEDDAVAAATVAGATSPQKRRDGGRAFQDMFQEQAGSLLVRTGGVGDLMSREFCQPMALPDALHGASRHTLSACCWSAPSAMPSQGGACNRLEDGRAPEDGHVALVHLIIADVPLRAWRGHRYCHSAGRSPLLVGGELQRHHEASKPACHPEGLQ